MATAEELSAIASVGTLVVVTTTAIAAFVQLRHLGTTNHLTVLNGFREEFERLHAAATKALPEIIARLEDPEARKQVVGNGSLDWAREAFPLMRLFETLGSYTTKNVVPRDLVCDQWAPVVLRYWNECEPLIAVMRRTAGPTLFENWEAIAVLSRRWESEARTTYPKGLSRWVLRDPWAVEDAANGIGV